MTGTKIPARFQTDTIGGIARVTYDFADYGGAVGLITLPLELPDGAIVTRGVVDVVTAPTSGGSATIALGLNAANDLLTATAIASFTGQIELLDDALVKLTADRKVTATVAVAALTGGVFNIYLDYYSPIRGQ